MTCCSEVIVTCGKSECHKTNLMTPTFIHSQIFAVPGPLALMAQCFSNRRGQCSVFEIHYCHYTEHTTPACTSLMRSLLIGLHLSLYLFSGISVSDTCWYCSTEAYRECWMDKADIFCNVICAKFHSK